MTGIHGQKEPELRMGRHRGDVTIDDPPFAERQEPIGFQQSVETIQHRGTAQIDVVNEQPVALAQGFHQQTVDPLETAAEVVGAR